MDVIHVPAGWIIYWKTPDIIYDAILCKRTSLLTGRLHAAALSLSANERKRSQRNPRARLCVRARVCITPLNIWVRVCVCAGESARARVCVRLCGCVCVRVSISEQLFWTMSKTVESSCTKWLGTSIVGAQPSVESMSASYHTRPGDILLLLRRWKLKRETEETWFRVRTNANPLTTVQSENGRFSANLTEKKKCIKSCRALTPNWWRYNIIVFINKS